jgi:EAL domain-containing protein (putative c-di-GMP-specific phosphodiesterase class I)/DNA-binding response OmpR family regulator
MEANMPRILLVDDDEFTLQLARDIFMQMGVSEVTLANSGLRGLAYASDPDNIPEIILCDLNMPAMDGIEFLRHLGLSQYHGAVAVLSGMDSRLTRAARDLANTFNLRMLDSVEKPVTREALSALLVQYSTLPAWSDESSPGKRVQLLTDEELWHGLANNALVLYYQPKVALSGRQMIGVEALARWQHPRRGLLDPSTFLPLVQSLEIFDTFTTHILRIAVRQLAEWRRAGHHISMSINLFAANLKDLTLPEQIERLCHDEGVESEDLILEITETGLMDDYQTGLDVLTRLRLKGHPLSVDDFGTGYANLERLRDLPFNEIKIDRSFVREAISNRDARTILASSANLARDLNLAIVAEGVESEEECQLVMELGCSVVQGYLISRPLPANQVLAWKAMWEIKQTHPEYPTVMVVDDEPIMNELVIDALHLHYHVVIAASGEDALGRLSSIHPDLLLLDISLPGMNGYEVCREIRSNSAWAGMPIIFVSGSESAEAKMRGYANGGDDYLVKPFDAAILRSRIDYLLRLARDRRRLQDEAGHASATAMTAMTAMGEMGVLLEAMKRLNSTNSADLVVNIVLNALRNFGIGGGVQLRLRDKVITRDQVGDASPLLAGIFANMRDRITQYKSRLCITYPYASILVQNMPLEDSDRCGRLRDLLAILAEAASLRVSGLLMSAAIQHSSTQISQTLATIDNAQRYTLAATTLAIDALEKRVEDGFMSLGLTEAQEQRITQIIRQGVEEILRNEYQKIDLQNQLTHLLATLQGAVADAPQAKTVTSVSDDPLF